MTSAIVQRFVEWLADNGYSCDSAYQSGEYFFQRDGQTVRVFTREGQSWNLEREDTFDSHEAAIKECHNLLDQT